jgi:nucleotide-binding universal stress UspA family protein
MKAIYKHILVPLDGSKLAEAALKAALPLAKLSGAKVTLLQVVWPYVRFKDKSIRVVDAVRILKKEASRYLQAVAERPGWKKLNVSIAIKAGLAENVIIGYARSKPIDLIVMSTHGRTGLKRWVFGSVADKVLRGATRPVLLVRAFSKGK